MELIYDGINVEVMHSDKTETQRLNIVNAFRIGKIWILITTDLMSRGIDFKGIKKVINFDPPNSIVNYIHRIGRTGRAGMPGTAITFYTEKDIPKIKKILPILRASNATLPKFLEET
uniref:RNA helicase n=1 Tax=Myxobolus squamalis TaxID=59785 RepID=A0A6B2G6P8_MYXSQ